MNGFTLTGEAGFACCRIDADGTAGTLTGRIQVPAGTPLLYAAVTGPPAGVGIVLTGPGGATYATATDTADTLVVTGADGPLAVLVNAPEPGPWTLGCTTTANAAGCATLTTAPRADPAPAALRALGPHLAPGTGGGPPDQFELFRATFRPFATVLAAAPAAPAMSLAAATAAVFGIPADAATALLGLVRGGNAENVLIALAQRFGATGQNLLMEVLANGSGESGLNGWSVGAGSWRTTTGTADALGWTSAFAADKVSGPCRKSATVDLVAAGLTDGYLDTSPEIEVRDWVCAIGPSGSTYALTARLLGTARDVLKEVRTTTMPVPPAAGDGLPGRTDWRQVLVSFRDYGPGVRYVQFEHTASDPAVDAAKGFRISGSSVRVLLSPGFRPAELVANPSGADGQTGWTGTGAWTTETGPGVACPQSAGATAFAVASGPAVKRQRIDLADAGYRPDFLDTAPLIQVGQWMATDPEVICTYTFKVVLRNGAGDALATVDSGPTVLNPASLPGPAFLPYWATISGYGAGLRTIDVEHSAEPERPVTGRNPAKITGTSVRILVQQPDPEPTPLLRRAAAAPPTAVPDTTVAPYKWVCLLQVTLAGGGSGVGTGWLIPAEGSRFYVMTAAHNLCSELGWTRSITIVPGANGTTKPFAAHTVNLEDMDVPLDWLADTQASIRGIERDYLFGQSVDDYALIRVPNPPAGWDPGGFRLSALDDKQMSNQAARITGYPRRPPYPTSGPPQMYAADITLSPYDEARGSTETDMRQGASGGPIYVPLPSGAHRAVGIVSHLGYFEGTIVAGFDLSYDFSYILFRRLTRPALAAADRWRRPVADNDRVCKLQLVIKTGSTGPTLDNAVFAIDGHDYDLATLWERGATHLFGGRNRPNDINVYDLTPELYRAHPGGPRLSDLLGTAWSLRRQAVPASWSEWLVPYYWFSGPWSVDHLALYVNDQLLYARMVRKVLQPGDQADGTIVRGLAP
ncbi:hypothetical protein [Nonomuraea jiangxiensis]|uniref:F-box associated region n=1 Tax=Nonomuraea jiangxiensis TaxID=633440 RepID=A0A1G9N9D7_9ACTN|nr:hypothetical protein [Nonomuraea jiangxiensis]SDL83118.1 F-box associated region [Nonomuraea jiangxiensis]